MKFIVGELAAAHDDFVNGQPLGNLLQSSRWAKIKNNWGAEILSVTSDSGEILLSSLALIRQLPLGYTMIYLPRGPIGQLTDAAVLSFYFTEVKRWAKSIKAVFVKFDPAVTYEKSAEFLQAIEATGARYLDRTENMHDTVQPRFNAMIYRDDFSEENLDKKTKQFLRKARNSASEISFGGAELVAEFAALMKKTEDRKAVSLRNSDYYKKLLDVYGDDAYITLVRMDLSAFTADAKAAVEKLQAQLTKTTNKKRQKQLTEELSVAEKNLSALTELIATHGEKVAVAGTLTINVFSAAETIYAGMDTDFQKYYPSYLAWYETIVHAFETGADTLNMGGLENSLSENDGLLKFKKHFNPRIEEYVGEFDMPVNRWLYPLVRQLYKRMRES